MFRRIVYVVPSIALLLVLVGCGQETGAGPVHSGGDFATREQAQTPAAPLAAGVTPMLSVPQTPVGPPVQPPPEAAASTAVSSTSNPGPAAAPWAPAPGKTDPITELNSTLAHMGAKVVAQTPEDDTANGTDAPAHAHPRSLEELARQVDELRADVKRLQDTVDLTISYVVGDLQEENRKLREEVARAYGVTPETSADGRDVVVVGNQGPDREVNAAPEASTAPKPDAPQRAAYGDAGYKVVKEWGRSPETAKHLGADVPSLRGMICAVPAGLTDTELSNLGRQIRAACDMYENIVVEAFDNEDAARAYVERNVRSTAHNVLSIQKDGATGQDVILLNRNGVSIQVPR